MSSKVREYAEYFVDGMDMLASDISDKLNDVKIKPKTGFKVGMVLGMNPITGPILGGLAAGTLGVFGASRAVKKILEVTDDKR